MFTTNGNCICCEKDKDKTVLLTKFSGVKVATCLLPKISGVEVTPSVNSAESSEQFWRKIRQIWRICEPCDNKVRLSTTGLLSVMLTKCVPFQYKGHK